MLIILNLDGTAVKVTPERIFQGSNDVTSVDVVAPYPNTTALEIGFILPSSIAVDYLPMQYRLQEDITGVTVGVWNFMLKATVTALMGIVGVSINAVTAEGNNTSYLCNFTVEESVMPALPPQPTPDVYELILQYYQQNISEIEKLYNVKQDKVDSKITIASGNVANAINELAGDVVDNYNLISGLRVDVDTNTTNIATNATQISYLYQNISQGENYIGTITQQTFPTDEQLDDLVLQVESRFPGNGDAIIFIQDIPSATDRNYKYIFTTKGWNYYEIPATEPAQNGSLGIIEGTYNTGSASSTQANIVGGQIKNIYVKDNDSFYRDLVEYINSNKHATDMNANRITNIVSGNTTVGNAALLGGKQEGALNVLSSVGATNDGLGNNINMYYLDKTSGATKQYVQDYALPKTFNDVYYISSAGLVDDIPNTPLDGVQFTKLVNSLGAVNIFTANRVLSAEYEFSKKNSSYNNVWITMTLAGTYEFRLTTQAKKAAEVNWTNLSITLSGAVNFAQNTLYNITFNSLFNELKQNSLQLDVGDNFRQILEIISDTSSANTVKVYCNSVYPSSFYLNYQTIVTDINYIGKPKEINISASRFVLDLDSGEYYAIIPQTEHRQPPGYDYFLSLQEVLNGSEREAVGASFVIDSLGNITITSAEPADYVLLVAAGVTE